MKNTIELAAKTLCGLFPKTDIEYSKGFTRWLQLSRKKKLDGFTRLYLAGFENIPENDAEFKRRLENMTDQEFENFKIGKPL